MNNNMIDHNETVLTKTVAMPADTNPNGDIFGGWLLSQMDVAGGILAKKASNAYKKSKKNPPRARNMNRGGRRKTKKRHKRKIRRKRRKRTRKQKKK